jgi:hypothetical protein
VVFIGLLPIPELRPSDIWVYTDAFMLRVLAAVGGGAMDHGGVLHGRRVDSVLAVLALTLGMLAATPGIAAALPGPKVITSPGAQARMYVRTFKHVIDPEIQLFDGFCKKGRSKVGPCVPVTSWQRKAIEARASRWGIHVNWVADPVADSWDFWVFSPIRWDGRDAKFRYRTRDTLTGNNCKTWGSSWWRWRDGSWHLMGGGSATGCGDVWAGR